MANENQARAWPRDEILTAITSMAAPAVLELERAGVLDELLEWLERNVEWYPGPTDTTLSIRVEAWAGGYAAASAAFLPEQDSPELDEHWNANRDGRDEPGGDL